MNRFNQCMESALATKQEEADARLTRLQANLARPEYSSDERVREALLREIKAADIMVPELRKDWEAARKTRKNLPSESVNVLLASFTEEDESHPLEMLNIMLVKGEVERREAALYRDLLRYEHLSNSMPLILSDVRDAMGMDDLSSVELGSREHQDARNTVEAAVFIKKLRFEFIKDNSVSSPLIYEEYEAMKHDVAMTDDLADVIAAHPEKLELVKKYVKERVTDYRAGAIELQSLKDYLSTPSQSLTDGVL